MSRRLPGWMLPAAGIGLPLLVVLSAILVLKPYYGVVDDAILLGYAHLPLSGFPDAWVDRVRYDVSSWGMVRPFYWAPRVRRVQRGSGEPNGVVRLN